jgi:hypothetical protein
MVDVLKAIRDALSTGWNLDGSTGKPSKAQITESGFVIIERDDIMDKRCISVSLFRASNQVRSTGTNPTIFSDDMVAVGVWDTQPDKNLTMEEKANMVGEVQRIIKTLKATPPTGIMDVNLAGRRPRTDLGQRDQLIAEDVFARVLYEN